MELGGKFTKVISENMNAAYNMGVSQSIDVIQDMIARLKEGKPEDNLHHVIVLDAAITLLINLKK